MGNELKFQNPMVVIGGGISGITAAVEAAEAGAEVVLVEREPYLGGRVFQMHQYFPKLCSPQCGMEINFQRFRSNSGVKIITLAEVETITGSAGSFEVKIKVKPSFINENCTACGKCVEVCPVEIDDEFNYSMTRKKAVYMAHPMAFPSRYAIDSDSCKSSECSKCAEVCEYDAIDLSKGSEEILLNARSVVFATGWKPYDAGRLDKLGFGVVPNVINNVMMERLAAPSGPSGGKIVRPSDGKEVKKIAFVQCAGSRDENYLPYCSSICCLASLKQATYVRQACPDSEVTIFYIDIRTPGRYESFYKKVGDDEKVSLIKGKVAKIVEDPSTNDVILTAEDVMGGRKNEYRMDMAVLATGMVPNLNGSGKNLMIETDENGFILPGKLPKGIYVSGVAERPQDVSSSVMAGTAAALKTIQGNGQ